jgi:hypothetical protein
MDMRTGGFISQESFRETSETETAKIRVIDQLSHRGSTQENTISPFRSIKPLPNEPTLVDIISKFNLKFKLGLDNTLRLKYESKKSPRLPEVKVT